MTSTTLLDSLPRPIGALNGAIVAADPVGAASRLNHIWTDGAGLYRSHDVEPERDTESTTNAATGELHPGDRA